jgi:hypothetical protein
VMLTGPDAAKLRESDPAWRTAVVDGRRSFGTGFGFLALGTARFESTGSDSLEIGPMYLRESQAEISKRPG